MEFHEKLQELRRQKGLTQEQLAEHLFVSRAAVSKWESGRGYPNIDSLKAIAAFYSVTIDALLSGEEMLTIAEETQKQQAQHFRRTVFGLLDLSAAAYLFLPLFGQQQAEAVHAVSLLTLTETAPYLKIAYLAVVISMILWGILSLVLQSPKEAVSLVLSVLGTLLFIISAQPYAAAFGFLLLGIKVFFLIKQQ